MAICKECNQGFEIAGEDRVFLQKFNAPDPTKCRACRQQQRLAFRNERNLHHRACGLTGKKIVSMYSPDKPWVVYDKEAWYSDHWDATDYGRDFDFSRPFFDQFYELQKVVPRLAIINVATENSDYINYAGFCKNCYLIFGSIQSEDCYYGSPYYCKNCVDIERVTHGELCYKCVDCKDLYNCIYLQNSSNCSDCTFGFDLHGCRDCFGCVGLRQKQYYIFNQPHSRQDYQKLVAQFHLNDRQHFEVAKKRFDEMRLKSIHLSSVILKSENCVGNHIYESRNCYHGFYLERVEDGRYINQLMDGKNVMDHDYAEELEWCYNNMGGYRLNNIQCCLPNVESHDLTYCDHCFSSNNCFGSVGLRHKKYCILNKQYSKEDYSNLKSQILHHMQKTGEWGEFFPVKYSLFGYNESMAQDEYYPMMREEVLKRGWPWHDTEPEKSPQNVTFDEAVHTCHQCQKHFRCIPQEVAFYKKMGIPNPTKCPLCRYHGRVKLRNPRRLWARTCTKCSAPIQTSYAPDRPEVIYCEKCYLKEVY